MLVKIREQYALAYQMLRSIDRLRHANAHHFFDAQIREIENELFYNVRWYVFSCARLSLHERRRYGTKGQGGF